MRASKRRISTLALAVCMTLFAFTSALVLPSDALAWDNCPKGLVNDPYPGACHRYVDTNEDGICDLSQPKPSETTTTSATTTTTDAIKEDEAPTVVGEAETTTTSGEPPTGDCPLGPCAGCGACLGIDTDSLVAIGSDADSSTDADADAALAAAVNSGGDAGGPSSGGEATATSAGDIEGTGFSLFTHYNVSPIAIVFFLVYAVSFVLHKTKRIRLATHRKIWNVLLAATFLITGIFGLILTVQLDYELPFRIPFDLLFWHVEAGVAMTLISLFHLGWHFSYYRNLVRNARKTMRTARQMEKARDAEERRLAWEARAARRATVTASRATMEPEL